MNIIGVIPARMDSSRFPGKPMAKILGTPMIGHVYLRSKLSKILNELYVATCDKEIHDYIISIGGKVIMTSNSHQRASDRTAEAVTNIEKEKKENVDIVVMLQGDEPMLHPIMIDDVVAPLLKNNEINVSNLMAEIQSIDEFEDPNEVKVVIDNSNFALYFSREPIPSRKKGSKSVTMLKQVCLIPFRKDFLIKYLNLEPTPLEIFESVDMNRILQHGFKIKMVKSNYKTYAVDTEEDLMKVEELMKNDSLIDSYLVKLQK